MSLSGVFRTLSLSVVWFSVCRGLSGNVLVQRFNVSLVCSPNTLLGIVGILILGGRGVDRIYAIF